MNSVSHISPLSRRQLIDEYFIENRTKLLDLAAFLDRLDRAPEESPELDYRMEAFREALAELIGEGPSRIKRVQRVFSDPTTEPLEVLDQKSATGAYRKPRAEAR